LAFSLLEDRNALIEEYATGRLDYVCIHHGLPLDANGKKQHKADFPFHEVISRNFGGTSCGERIEFPSLGHFSYSARFVERNGDNVIVELMDDRVNLLDWGVTLESLQRKAQELVGRPVAAPVIDGDVSKGDFVIDKKFKTHAGTYHRIGTVAETMLRGNRLLARIQITDPRYTECIPEYLPAVSPAINVLKAEIDYTSGRPKVVATDFLWDHVLFTPKGAYPNAHVISKCKGDESTCNLTHVFAAAIAPILENVRNGNAEKVAKLRLAAGLIERKRLPGEIKRLGEFTNDALMMLGDGANRFIDMNQKMAGALVPFDGALESLSEAREAIERVRMSMYGYRRDAKFLAAALGRMEGY
jgi:hypothetical protein